MENNNIVKDKKVFNIKYKYVALSAYIYMTLPIMIFFIGWLKLYIGIFLTLVLVGTLHYVYKKYYKLNEEVIELPMITIVIISIVVLLCIWFTGIGNVFVGSHDYPWRSAIFRDLINYKWPVIYNETNNMFVYYFFFWLVPAIFGKIFGWAIGNLTLIFWVYIGIGLMLCIVAHALKLNTPKKLWILCIIFILWGGLNTVGGAYADIFNIGDHHFSLGSEQDWLFGLKNGYSFNFYYRSNFDALSQVFNQVIMLWLGIALILERNKVELFAFTGLCILPYAPIPFIGLLPILFTLFVVSNKEHIKKWKYKEIIKQIFSIPNIVASIIIFPIIYLFFKMNLTTSVGSSGFFILPIKMFDRIRVISLFVFWILQFGVIVSIIFHKYRKNKIFFICVFMLMIVPLIEFGKRGGRDFCMNASLPALFVIMYMVIKYICNEVVDKYLNFKSTILIITLTLMSLSPIQTVIGKINLIYDSKQFPIIDESIGTFSDKHIGVDYGIENFIVPIPNDSLFYKYIMRR